MSNFTLKSNKDIFQKACEQQIIKALTECGLEAVRFASTNLSTSSPIAVDTGNLRQSVTYCVAGENPGISSYKPERQTSKYGGKAPAGGTYSGTMPKEDNPCVYLGTNVSYGPAIELGKGKMKARPYIKPAISEHSDKYSQIIKANLKNG